MLDKQAKAVLKTYVANWTYRFSVTYTVLLDLDIWNGKKCIALFEKSVFFKSTSALLGKVYIFVCL